jgi:hypothetical protein
MKNFRVSASLTAVVLFLLALNGCITFRSDMNGTYTGGEVKNVQRAPVAVFFHFSHLEQQRGYNVVPKIASPVPGFNDLFSESLKEFSNIRSYTTFTDAQQDAEDFNRRHLLDSLRSASDMTIHLTIKKENSFAKHFFSDFISICSLTIIPVSFSWDYTVTADVTNASGKLLKSYSRQFTLTQWTHAVFTFVYPFYPIEMKTEEIYYESLHNIFKQIEAEGALTK